LDPQAQPLRIALVRTKWSYFEVRGASSRFCISSIFFLCAFHIPKGAKRYPRPAQPIIHVTAAHWGKLIIVFRPNGANIPTNQIDAINALRPNDREACLQYSRR
ncbi:MAG: hypothetical protein WBM31_04225, partial [Pseudolabrys sp.]